MFHVEQWPRYQATGCAPASARTSIACMQLEIEGPVFRKLPELARVICLGMSALDAIYRFPVIPATPVKVLAPVCCGSANAVRAEIKAAATRLVKTRTITIGRCMAIAPAA